MRESIVLNPYPGAIYYFLKEEGLTLEILEQEYNLGLVFERRICHRLDGPALTYSHPEMNADWFIMNEHVDTDEYLTWIKEMGIDLNNLTGDDEMLIILRWAK